jgi:trans-L-3-hydroxyproline dehydratase
VTPWKPPPRWGRITTIDAHAAGEPLRVVTAGWPDVPGDTMLARRRYVQEHLDHLRTAIMWEPRGHADMYGCLVTPPASSDGDLGVLFMHNEGYSTMCGHGIVALATVALQTGLLPPAMPETVVRIDTPAGRVTARVQVRAGAVTRVAFENVPSFVLALDQAVEVAGLGRVRYDLAFGGAFYAYVQAGDVGLEIVPGEVARLIDRGMAIKRAVAATHEITHPLDPDLGYLYGTIFVAPARAADVHSRNVCIFADGQVDRSPTGTGVSGRLAIHHARGELGLDQRIEIESIAGTRFAGRVVSRASVGPHEAIVPEIEGAAHITGRHEFLIDPDDPLGHGFRVA